MTILDTVCVSSLCVLAAIHIRGGKEGLTTGTEIVCTVAGGLLVAGLLTAVMTYFFKL